MRAKIKEDCTINLVTAFGGFKYNRQTWERVPAGCESEAEGHGLLEVQADEPEAQIELEDLTMPELRDLAKVAGVPTRNVKKADLVSALEGE